MQREDIDDKNMPVDDQFTEVLQLNAVYISTHI